MPTPEIPQRFSPVMADLYRRLHAIAESERMTALVDYLDDLRKEFDWAAVELRTLGFCARCYFSSLDDGGDHDCMDKN